MNLRHSIRGFSMIELMVGIVIGLIVILIIGQVAAGFEGQKRTSTGGSDAQTNGMLALGALEREIRSAGFGLGRPGDTGVPGGMTCSGINIYYNGTSPKPSDGKPVAPVAIVDGGSGSDKIIVFRSDTVSTIAPIPIFSTPVASLAASPPTLTIDATNGAALNFEGHPVVMLAATDGSKVCTLLQVSAVFNPNAAGDSCSSVSGVTTGNLRTLCFSTGLTSQYKYNPSASLASTFTHFGDQAYSQSDMLFDLNGFEHRRYEIDSCGQLVSSNADAIVTIPSDCTGTNPIASNIVFMKAQYGVAPANSQVVNAWTDATGATWAWDPTVPTPSTADIARIKAVRIAVVARNSEYNRDPVTTAAVTLWPGKTWTPTGDAQHYRYKVFETVAPIRNMIWTTKVWLPPPPPP